MNEPDDLALYIHWPFCQAKCPYCDFNSHVVRHIDQTQWADALGSEITRWAGVTSDRRLKSIFFGGGTPSLMEVSTLERVLWAAQQSWKWANDIEISLEANPSSVEAQRFEGYRSAGVNRISIGIQALNDSDLRALGRLHTVHEALKALEIARHCFDNVNFDLIYARQFQSVEAWQTELQQALSYEPRHLALYQLTIEDGTVFAARKEAGHLRGLPSEDVGADLWDATQELTQKAGLPAYEVSNHAVPGSEAIHNLNYWSGGDWLGIGPGAHGRITLDNRRWATETEKEPSKWLAGVKRGSKDHEQKTALSARDVFVERLMMGLRMTRGIAVNESDEISTVINGEKLAELVELGLIHATKNCLSVTDKGRPLLNAIIRELIID